MKGIIPFTMKAAPFWTRPDPGSLLENLNPAMKLSGKQKDIIKRLTDACFVPNYARGLTGA